MHPPGNREAMPPETVVSVGNFRENSGRGSPLRFPIATMWRMLIIALPFVVSAADNSARISYMCREQNVQRTLTVLSDLCEAGQELGTDDLIAGMGDQTITLALADASPATQRQAVAHALGCWWALHPDKGVVYTRGQAMPCGTLNVRTYTSGLRGGKDWEDLVRQIMKPWLSAPNSGLSYQGDIGVWSATMDNQGHARLVEALSLLERPAPQAPPDIPDPDTPDLLRRLPMAIRANSWPDLAAELSRAAGISISIGQTLRSGKPEFTVESSPLASLHGQFARNDVQAQFIHGVLCLDRQPILEREHPGQRRRLAVLPIAHLASTRLDGELLVAALRRRVEPAWWDMPGAALSLLPDGSALIVSADATTISAIGDALDRIDRMGMEEGLDALNAASSGGR